MSFEEWWAKVNRTYDSDSPGFPNYRDCWNACAAEYENKLKPRICQHGFEVGNGWHCTTCLTADGEVK